MAEINVSEITEVNVNGSGVFDQLMKTVQIGLDTEFQKQRIKSTDYSKVYLGTVQSVLQQSLAFVMGKQTADKQAELLIVQAANEVLQGLLITEQTAKVTAEKLVTDQQLLNLQVDNTNAVKAGLKLDAENAILAQQLLKLQQETLLTTAQISKVNQDTATGVVQEANIVQDTATKITQISKLNQDISISQAQELNVVEERAKIIAEVSMVTQSEANAVIQGQVLTNQVTKVAAEQSLLDQKKLTEEAQIVDRVTGAAADVVGVIGKQKGLYTAQTDGFARDAEQKLLKIASDNFAVRLSNTPSLPPPDGYSDVAIDEIIDKAREGIGMNAYDPAP